MGLVVLDLEVENFEGIKGVQIVEVGGRICLYLFKERGDVSLVLEGQLQHRPGNVLFAESEGKLDVCDVILTFRVINQPSILSQLEILSHLLFHVFAGADVIGLDPASQLL